MISPDKIGDLHPDAINPRLAPLGAQVENETQQIVPPPRFDWRKYALTAAMGRVFPRKNTEVLREISKSLDRLPPAILERVPTADLGIRGIFQFSLVSYTDAMQQSESVHELRAKIIGSDGSVMPCLIVHEDEFGVTTEKAPADFNADELSLGVVRDLRIPQSGGDAFFAIPLVVAGDPKREQARRGIDYALIRMFALSARILSDDASQLREAMVRLRRS